MAEITSPTVDEFQKELLVKAISPDPLHPDLESFVIPAHPGELLQWDVLKHPLVFGVPYTPAWNHLYNKQYEDKKKALRECVSKEEWNRYIFLHERPHRFDAFEEVVGYNKLSGPEYWSLLGSIWSDSENLWQIGYRKIKRFLQAHPEHRGSFMDDCEKKLLQLLPDKVRVFRGHQRKNQRGFSWTLAYTTAVWFSQRFYGVGHAMVSQGVVSKSDVVGLILGRSEMEIVVDPRHVTDLQVFRPVPRSESLEQLKKDLLKQFRLHGRSAHGESHWDKVDRNVVELCGRVPGTDLIVGRLFAIFHDSCRWSESRDPKHGHRAADLVTLMYRAGKIPGITEEQFKKLEYACRNHNGGKPVSDPTIGVCFDADRLDLIRVGVIPDPNKLSTQEARDLIGLI